VTGVELVGDRRRTDVAAGGGAKIEGRLARIEAGSCWTTEEAKRGTILEFGS